MRFLKKLVSLTHQMARPFYHTRAIRPSTSPGNQVSVASVTRQFHNKVNPGPLRQLYNSRARSFSPLICAFGLVSGGSIFRQLQMINGPSQNDFFNKPKNRSSGTPSWVTLESLCTWRMWWFISYIILGLSDHQGLLQFVLLD